jgi:oligoendopeptidase F
MPDTTLTVPVYREAMTTDSTAVDLLPTWNTDRFFPGLDSREFASDREAVVADLGRLRALYDRHDIRSGASRPVGDEDRSAVAEVLTATNELLERLQTLEAYIYAFVSTDAGNDLAAGEEARLQADLVVLEQLQTRFDAWVGRLGADGLAEGNDEVGDHRYTLRRSVEAAEHQMSEVEEQLLGELRLSGGTAWARLAGDISSRLTGTLDGEVLPITVLRGQATGSDPARRETAYRAEVAAWETAAVPMAAALNGIKGEAVTVNTRRGWPDALAPALWSNAVELEALGAMQAAVTASFPDFRRFLRAKAELHARQGDGPGGTGPGLAWWNMVAPVPGEATVDWGRATDEVERAFASFSPQLASLARRAFEESWVDAGPRTGKRGGAFCMPVRGPESRVMMNFDGSWDSVSTLAHELGHAYHNTNLADRSPMQRRTPMALAETASIFCETILVQSGLVGAAPAERLALLNLDLTGAVQVVVDIHSRFLFEQSLFEHRADGPVSPTDLCQLMTDAQRATYGDGLDLATLHPYMWAVKPHYYAVEAHFYNWPYTFGLLFGIGLYARYQQDPDHFRSGYDHLLASTGMGTAAELAGRFGIDIADEAFWTASLDVIRARIDDFVALAG